MQYLRTTNFRAASRFPFSIKNKPGGYQETKKADTFFFKLYFAITYL